jgi:hypothetical protein
MEDIYKALGQVLAYGGGGAAVAYLMFQFLSKKWIESKFAEKLELFRHTQAIELQKLRVEIDSLLSGTIKLQEKEFEILPEVWDRLNAVYEKISGLLSPFKSYPDLERMPEDAMKEFMESTPFTQSQRKEVVQSGRMNGRYQEYHTLYMIHEVKLSYSELEKLVARNGIFLQPELRDLMESMSEAIWSSITSKEIGHDAQDWKMQKESLNNLRDTVKPLYKDIETYIHTRLQSHGQTPNDKSLTSRATQ